MNSGANSGKARGMRAIVTTQVKGPGESSRKLTARGKEKISSL